MIENKNSTAKKIVETFMVSFFVTIGCILGTLVTIKNAHIISMFAGLGGIVGLIISYTFNQNVNIIIGSIQNSSLTDHKSGKNLIPTIATALTSLMSLALYKPAGLLLLNLFQTPINSIFLSVFSNFILFGSINGVVLTSIKEIKVYGFNKSSLKIIRFCLSRILAIIAIGFVIIPSSSILFFILLLAFLSSNFVGFGIFMSLDIIVISIPFLTVFIIAETYLLYRINKALFKMYE
jgi:hypothetical protein